MSGNFKPGDRCVVFEHPKHYTGRWKRRYPVGSVFTLVEFWGTGWATDRTRLPNDDATLCVQEDRMVHEHIYNSRLYKVLQEEE